MLPDLAQRAVRTLPAPRACAARTAGTSRLSGVIAATPCGRRAAPCRL